MTGMRFEPTPCSKTLWQKTPKNSKSATVERATFFHWRVKTKISN